MGVQTRCMGMKGSHMSSVVNINNAGPSSTKAMHMVCFCLSVYWTVVSSVFITSLLRSSRVREAQACSSTERSSKRTQRSLKGYLIWWFFEVFKMNIKTLRCKCIVIYIRQTYWWFKKRTLVAANQRAAMLCHFLFDQLLFIRKFLN